jgi:signal transduction histidine kinase
MRFTLNRGILAGAVVGGGTALGSLLLAEFTREIAPFVSLIVLVVALVGLGIGAAAALAAYGTAGLVVIALALAPVEGAGLTTADAIRIGSFAIGSPLVVLLALRAEREREAARRASQESEQAMRLAGAEREVSVAARRELREALRRAEQERTRLEEVAEAIPEPLIVYDAEARGTYANRAAMRLFGRSFYDRPVDEWARLAEPRDERGEPLPRDEWPQLRARREAFQRRLTVRLPMSGRDMLVDTEGTPIPDGGCVLLLRDVGKEVDERRRLSRFASFVAHELRNPLAVAKARIELAGREPAVPTRAAEHGARALESVDAAIAILERLELFSRAEAGRLEAEHRPFDVGAAVDAALEQLAARGSDRPVRRIGPPAVRALGDQRLSEQAIANLLINADRYSTPEAPIQVEVRDGETAELRVIDDGPGIADEVADLLFRDRVTSGRGLGLGLYLVRAAMEAQGGSVRLEQRRPRAVFGLRWPSPRRRG